MSGESATWLGRALELARAGGQAIERVRSRPGGAVPDSKGIRRDLITAADRACEEVVVGGLLAAFPEHAVLAEEGVLTPKGERSRDSDHVWVVDPIDGTTNFVHGLPYYGVAIGLLVRDEPVLGVVHAPALGKSYRAVRGGGAFCNDQPIRVTEQSDMADALLATGFSYRRGEAAADDNSERLRRAMHACRDLRRFGSAQLDLCMTAAGHFDAYWEVLLEPWDVVAGAMIVREAGGLVTDLRGGEAWKDGSQILASNGVLHGALLRVVGDVS